MFELAYIIGTISTSVSDKHRSKVANLVKYVYLQEVGAFQIIISVIAASEASAIYS